MATATKDTLSPSGEHVFASNGRCVRCGVGRDWPGASRPCPHTRMVPAAPRDPKVAASTTEEREDGST